MMPERKRLRILAPLLLLRFHVKRTRLRYESAATAAPALRERDGTDPTGHG